MTAPHRRRATPSPIPGILALALIVALAVIASALVKVDPRNLDQPASASRFSVEAGLNGCPR